MAAQIELDQMCIYLYNLVGLNTDRYPDRVGRMVLIDFMRANFGGNSLDEVKLAFQMAAAGKIDVDINHYQSFSSLYFGKVMAAYRTWANQVHEYNEKIAKPEEMQQEIPDMSDEDLLTATFETYKLIKQMDFIPEAVFTHLENAGKIKLSIDEKYEVRQHVLKTWEVTTEHEVKSYCRKWAVARYFDYCILNGEMV